MLSCLHIGLYYNLFCRCFTLSTKSPCPLLEKGVKKQKTTCNILCPLPSLFLRNLKSEGGRERGMQQDRCFFIFGLESFHVSEGHPPSFGELRRTGMGPPLLFCCINLCYNASCCLYYPAIISSRIFEQETTYEKTHSTNTRTPHKKRPPAVLPRAFLKNLF